MQNTVEVQNPFGKIPTKDQTSASVEIEQSRAAAEVQAAMGIAKRFQRNPILAMDRILNACTRQAMAESALYTYSRGGTEISGPSIRLAEAIAQNWGNIHFGIKEVEQADGISTVEAYAWDLETNTRQSKVFQIRHERHTRRGSYTLTDTRDIYELIANNGARRLRACILGIIPGDVIEAAVAQCEATMRTKIQITPERLKEMEEKFAKYGVSKAQIEMRIQRRIDAITPAQMVSLGKIFNSLKDGMSTPGDWFQEIPVEQKPAEKIGDKIKTKKQEDQHQSEKQAAESTIEDLF